MTEQPTPSDSLFQAIHQGDASTAQQLVSDNPALLTARSPSGLSPVLFATYYGKPAIAQLLVDAGAPLTAFEAAAAGQLAVLESHLARDPELLNVFSPDGFQLLGLAAFFGHVNVARALLARGADADAPSQNDMQVRPLHSATAGGHAEIAALLLAAGAHPDARQRGGFTPLMSAAQNGDITSTELLLRHGSDRTIATAEGRTALDFAVEGGHVAVVELLRA